MGHWDKVNIISAVSTDQRLHFRLKVGEAFHNGDFVSFLKHMLHHVEGRLVVFVDGGGLHKGEEFYVFLAENQDRLRVEPLPPYGFEYNPDEGVWGYLKGVELRSFAPRNTPELVARLRKGLGKMRRRPRLIGSFFRKSKLPRADVELLLNRPGRR
jgi:transposase